MCQMSKSGLFSAALSNITVAPRGPTNQGADKDLNLYRSYKSPNKLRTKGSETVAG